MTQLLGVSQLTTLSWQLPSGIAAGWNGLLLPKSCSLHPIVGWCQGMNDWLPHLHSERPSQLQSFGWISWALVWNVSQINFSLCPVLLPSLLTVLILRTLPTKTPSMPISTSEHFLGNQTRKPRRYWNIAIQFHCEEIMILGTSQVSR